MKPSIIAGVCALGLLAFPSFADEPAAPAQPKPKPKPCSTAEYRQFDFWLGDWDVTPAGKDKPTAENHIRAMHNGCLVRENYKNGAYTGSSMSFFDNKDKHWHQTWIGSGGGALYIVGGLNDKGAMVMSDTALAKAQNRPVNRITWTPNEDGSVRQVWDVSKDEGETWSVLWSGLYTKMAAKQGAD